MTFGQFPANPHERRLVMVINETDIDKCIAEGKAQFLIDDQTYVMPYPVQVSENDPPVKKALARMARPGDILSQSPYNNDRYFDISNETVELAVDKYLVFSTICGILGARSVSIEQINYNNREEKAEWKAGAGYKQIGGSINGGKEKIEALRGGIKIDNVFPGGKPNINRAKEVLEINGLTMDQQFLSLIDARSYDENRIQKRKFELSLYNSFNSNLKIFAQLQIPQFIKGSMNYSKDVKETEEISVKILVEF